jgi:hypothetical protein
MTHENVSAWSLRQRRGVQGRYPPSTSHWPLVTIHCFRSRFRSEAARTGMDTRRATEGSAGALDSTSRGPTERNAADMPGSAAAVETR